MSACQGCQASSVESRITYCPRPRLLCCPSFYLHTTSKNPPPVSWTQAYIAYFFVGDSSEYRLSSAQKNDPRNGCCNALETVVL